MPRLMFCAFLLVSAGSAQPTEEKTRSVLERATADFKAGRIADSVRGFDQVAQMAPALAPQLWQRGIALYYAGRYRDCRAQFEAHRKVNPDDVENAAWHFLCVARAESPLKARAALLPVGPDARVPMREVLQLFAGMVTPDDVLRAAGARAESRFYAHLYIGLYFEATGLLAKALEHIAAAAEPGYAVGGYMHDVARVHLSILRRASIC